MHFMCDSLFSPLVSLAFVASTAAAFAPSAQRSVSNAALHATANRASPEAVARSTVDSTGNNIAVKNFLESVESTGLLTKVAQAGLLSKLSANGITLSKLEPLITLAAEKGLVNEVLILTEAAGPDIIPLLPTIVDLAPAALPLLAAAVDIPPALLVGAAVASVGATYGIVTAIPDNTVIEVAEQTLAVATLGLAVPAASLAGAAALGFLKK